MRPLIFVAAIPLLMLFAGCASLESGEGSDRNRISEEELQEADASNLFELVDRERPRWLQVRTDRSLAGGSTQVLVYEGNTRLGGVEVLEGFHPSEVDALEYIDGSTASAMLPGLGDEHVAGVIMLHR